MVDEIYEPRTLKNNEKHEYFYCQALQIEKPKENVA